MRLFLAILLCALSLQVEAQKKYKQKWNNKKEKKEVFPSADKFKPSGWMFGAGVTGTFGFEEKKESITMNNITYDASYTTQIRPGIMLEVGRYTNFTKGKFLKGRLFRYIDYSLAYKALWSREKFELTNTATETIEGTNNSGQHYLSLNFNVNNIIDLPDYNFIQNAIGINADYRFTENRSEEYPAGIAVNNDPGSFIAQAHYKLGFGFKFDNDIMIVPSIEVPVFNLTPTQDEFSRLDFFNSSFQAVIVRVQVLLFKLGPTKCPPVNNPNLPNDFQNGYGD